jgi:tetratricopeptide (TPR) repeat protein
LVLFSAGPLGALAQSPASRTVPPQTSATGSDPAAIFRAGQLALETKEYKRAEEAFRTVINLDPRSFAAYANLGVVYMREKRWNLALTMLHKAEKLNPGVAGIRRNIGLAEYRQGKFEEAIPAFLSAMEDDPTSVQARYLLGLCYFFRQDYGNAVSTLQPLAEVEWNDLKFLYVLAISGWQAKQPELEQRTMARLIEIGANSPEFHLLMGKAHLNREEYDDAINELQLAAQASPKLPFVHFSLARGLHEKPGI